MWPARPGGTRRPRTVLEISIIDHSGHWRTPFTETSGSLTSSTHMRVGSGGFVALLDDGWWARLAG